MAAASAKEFLEELRAQTARTGLEQMVLQLAGRAQREDLVLRLYQNDVTPGEASRAADFKEAKGGGYMAKTITAWTADGLEMAAPAQTWVLARGVSPIYGYYLTGAKSGVLYWAGRFRPQPLDVTATVTEVRVAPRFRLVP